MRPLDRRHALLSASLDEDSSRWPASALAHLEDAARRAEMARDRRLVAEGREMLADYLQPGMSYRDAVRLYLDDQRLLRSGS